MNKSAYHWKNDIHYQNLESKTARELGNSRNKNQEPFNPLLTSYAVNDNLPPIPKKLIITNLDKDSYVNGLPKEAEFEILKISETEYSIKNIISSSMLVSINLKFLF